MSTGTVTRAPAPPARGLTRLLRRGVSRRSPRDFDRPRFLRWYVGFVYLFLFAPILVVVLFSFNGIKSLQNFEGFSLQWYEEFLSDATLRESLFASLEIALLTMLAATAIGTALAIGLVRARTRWNPAANVLMLVPLVTPEIVTGISALLIFSQIGIALSFWTIVIAHITFSISYVTIVVRARLVSVGREVEEAALDLGAKRWQSVRLVLLPALWPAVVAAGLLVFAFSFDDFVLSFFTTGEDLQPLPVRIWSAIRFGLSPTINAIGTLMMVVSLAAIGLALALPRLFGRRESGIKVLTASEG
jgi:spermidine/putrescine transport system permease protein